ncbi:uncharacterized protein [Miscanthus floridulus]|uniref:uncharacterized protein isoform X1 n=1 Tax=Miscanthus floridulus TaxID=154761 RepID=UPI00345AF23A
MPELIGEILVRFPPDDPACLVRASMVCKPWRRLLCDPAFRRRYLAFHRAPPLLGFLHNCYTDFPGYHDRPRARFVSTTTPCPLPVHAFGDWDFGWRVLDCHHGRILMATGVSPVVWDPTTGEQNRLPEPPFPRYKVYTAAVLCADVHGCDHLDCHGGPFLVVLVGFNIEAGVLQSHLYSSEASTWSSSDHQGPRFLTVPKPSVLIGDDIYFILLFRPSVTILKVDLGKNHLSTINQPAEYHLSIINRREEKHDFEWKKVALMAMEDGSLGFAGILGSRLCLWSRNVNPELVGGWVQCRVLELQTLIPFTFRLRAVGSVEGSGIVFVASDYGVFSLELKSSVVRKVDEPLGDFAVFPFMRFYTPVSDMVQAASCDSVAYNNQR